MIKLSPNLFVTSVKESIAFYEKFGFKAEQVIPDAENPIWASVASGNVEIMLQEKNSGMQEFAPLAGKQLGATLTLFMQTENIENNYNAAKTNNFKIVNDLHKTFYGTSEFAVQDPDGYICVFASK
ncbi:MAG: VOC family protein [Bacteroidales bacterium]|nr:VOC family protein [Bacteroidales bacterium]